MASVAENRSRTLNRSTLNPAMETLVTEAEEKRYAELQLVALDAARAGDTPLLTSMIAAGLPVNLQDHKGNSLLMLASYHGHISAVRALLEAGADPDRRNLRQQTPLGGVAFKGYTEVARLLLDHGADLSAEQGGGATPVMLASLFGRNEMVKLLNERRTVPAPRRQHALIVSLLGLLGRSARSLLHLARFFQSLIEPQSR